MSRMPGICMESKKNQNNSGSSSQKIEKMYTKWQATTKRAQKQPKKMENLLEESKQWEHLFRNFIFHEQFCLLKENLSNLDQIKAPNNRIYSITSSTYIYIRVVFTGFFFNNIES